MRIIGQHLCDAAHAVSVSIRFDDSEKLGRSNSITHNLCVMSQRTSVDLNPTSISLVHVLVVDLGIVICGSRRYIGSPGGKAKTRIWILGTRAQNFSGRE